MLQHSGGPPSDAGGVRVDDVVKGEVAAWIAGALKRYMDRELRTNGKRPPLFAQELFAALAEAAGDPTPIAASGSAPVTVVSTTWIEVRVAAAQVGLSERRIRQLAESHRVRAQKVGPVWQIDIDSLTNVPRRAA